MSQALAELTAVPGPAGLDLGRLVLEAVAKTKGLANPEERIDTMVVGGSLNRTMEGASNLVVQVHDPRRTLLRSGLIEHQCALELDDTWWRLLKVAKSGDQLELTFEDRSVALLRLYNSPRKASRASMTRAEFALSLVREVKQDGGIPFISPQLTVVQKVAAPAAQPDAPAAPATPITSSSNRLSTDPTVRAASVQAGFPAGVTFTIEGAPASSEQIGNAQRVLDVAASLNAGALATLALIEACIDESGMKNLSYGTGTSTGILQVLQSTGQDMGVDPMNIEQCVNAFLTRGFTGKGSAIDLARQNPGWSAGTIAQAVQGSAFADPYDRYQTEAEAIISAYTGSPVTAAAALAAKPTAPATDPYQFQRGTSDGGVETSWDCLQRLAGEVNWRCFVTSNICYFVAETTLIGAQPQATINERTLGVDAVDFDCDNGKPLSEATVTARATRWGFPPGCVIELADVGPANGRWLVTTIARDLFDTESTITLKRATVPLYEPAPPAQALSVVPGAPAGATATDPAMTSTAMGGQAPQIIADLYQAAIAFTAKRWPYVWGGGHAHAGVADNPHLTNPYTGAIDPGIGFDCSGTQAAILCQVGMGFQPGQSVPGSGDMAASWGEPGEGQYFTLWANNDHVFSFFHTSKGDVHCGTDVEPDGIQPQLRSTAGFTPRHWPGC
jgi:hypothetical protein